MNTATAAMAIMIVRIRKRIGGIVGPFRDINRSARQLPGL